MVIFSQEVLLALIKKGLVREEAYKLVQKNAMKSWNEGSSFMENIKSDSNIMSSISVEELESLFDLDKILININKIYKRMGLDG